VSGKGIEKIKFGSTDLIVSKIAMGGIPIMRLSMEEAVKVVRDVIDMGVNFIDTANAYDDSEEKIGEAIKPYKRKDLVLSSKSLVRDKKTFLSHIDLSLKRLSTDYIDIYHIHNISDDKDFIKVMEPEGVFEGLEEAVKKGKVQYKAFSSHDPRIAEKIIKTGKFQVMQVPLNFIDTESEERLIPLAHRLNIGFIAMKPLGGGLLEDARLAFKYLAQFEGIIPDPGVEKAEEMEEIINIIKDPHPITREEKQKIKRIKEELGDNWCHRCGYCQPCPEEIPITLVLNVRSMIKRFNNDKLNNLLENAIENARDCSECRECVEKCPYDLDIPEMLKENIGLWENYKKDNKNL